VPRYSLAQAALKQARIGVLFPGTQASWVDQLGVVRRALHELGWVEGQNLDFVFRFADGHYERLPALAAELVAARPDVIFAGSAPAIRAAMQATTSVPIVFETFADVVAVGLAHNLGRPGSNVTGVSGFSPELNAKRLQFMHEMLPRATRFALLANLGNPATPPGVRVTEAAARQLQVQITVVDVRAPEQLEGAFEAMARQRMQGLVVASDPMLFGHQRRIVELAARHRLPAAYDARSYVDEGGLMSYGSGTERFQQVGGYLDRVLRGARPADLPIAQPTQFELVLNLQAAAAMSLNVPQTLLQRADKVIEQGAAQR
jgi:putative ABC transport system substrate-binding protein